MISAAALMAAAASFFVMSVSVVVTGCFRILHQCSGQKRCHCLIRISADSGVQLDARLLESHSGASSDSAADQGIHSALF